MRNYGQCAITGTFTLYLFFKQKAALIILRLDAAIFSFGAGGGGVLLNSPLIRPIFFLDKLAITCGNRWVYLVFVPRVLQTKKSSISKTLPVHRRTKYRMLIIFCGNRILLYRAKTYTILSIRIIAWLLGLWYWKNPKLKSKKKNGSYNLFEHEPHNLIIRDVNRHVSKPLIKIAFESLWYVKILTSFYSRLLRITGPKITYFHNWTFLVRGNVWLGFSAD